LIDRSSESVYPLLNTWTTIPQGFRTLVAQRCPEEGKSAAASIEKFVIWKVE